MSLGATMWLIYVYPSFGTTMEIYGTEGIYIGRGREILYMVESIVGLVFFKGFVDRQISLYHTMR